MYLIDTTVVSEARKKSRADPGVIDFFARVAGSNDRLYLSVITIGELRRGIELIRRRGDTPQAIMLENWLTDLLEHFADRVLGINEDVAQVWGRLRVPHPEHALDKQIAATALVYDLTVVTRNAVDFEGSGARILNPFT